MNLKVLKATFLRNFMIQFRAYPKSFFIGNVLTGIYTSLGALFMYKLLFNGNTSKQFYTYTGTGDYMSFVILGTLIYIFVVRTCLNVSRSLITELREGTLESIMLAPFKRVQYFMGNMLQQTITTGLEVCVSIIIAIPFGLTLRNINMIGFLLSCLLGLFAFFGVSMVLACIMLYTRDTYISQNTLFALLFLLCGITFPIDYLPLFVRHIANLIPITGVVEIIRNTALLGMPLSSQISDVIYVSILSLVYTLIGFRLIKKIEYIALEKIQG